MRTKSWTRNEENMYSKKEKLKAIKLYIKYNKKSSTVRRELGYPTKNALRNWYKDYITNGEKIINHHEFLKYSSIYLHKKIKSYIL